MKMSRKLRRHLRQVDAIETKLVNRVGKTKERARRDERMVAKLKAGSLPYTPPVMSWLSRKLEKASSRITQNEVNALTN